VKKIRRYYGHDCDSIMGFNNGYYIDDNDIQVTDIDDAFKKCKKWILKNYKCKKSDLTELDNGYELITGYYDNDGNDITQKQFNELNDIDSDDGAYRYIYVTFESID